jgi:hypothetical protein
MTPSAQPSARKARLAGSAITGTIAPRLVPAGRARCGSGAAARTRITVWPRSAACAEALASGPEMSTSSLLAAGSHATSCALATARWKRQ